MVRNVHKTFLCFFDPVVGGDFPARIAEATFAGVSDVMFSIALFADVQAVTELLSISAVHHFFDVFFYRIPDFVYTEKMRPVVFEYLLQRILAGYLFQHISALYAEVSI